MRGEDLLAQRRARSRHADDEDRRGVRVLRPRTGNEAIVIERCDIGVDEGAILVARKRLAPFEQLVARLPLRERARVCILPRPELRKIVMPHDAVFEHGFRAHRFKRGFHLLGRGTGARDVICGPRQQHLPPVPQRRETGRDRAERGESIERGFCFRGAAELEERQRLLQIPVAYRPQIAGRRWCITEHRQRVAGALILQKIRRQVKPRSDVVWIPDDSFAQQLFGGFGFAADPHKGGEI